MVGWLRIKFKDWIERWLVKNSVSKIVGSSLLGAIPGCMDAFFAISLYAYCLVGFGSLVAAMLSTAGGGAFVMLAMIPKTAFWISTICAVLLKTLSAESDHYAPGAGLSAVGPGEVSKSGLS